MSKSEFGLAKGEQGKLVLQEVLLGWRLRLAGSADKQVKCLVFDDTQLREHSMRQKSVAMGDAPEVAIPVQYLVEKGTDSYAVMSADRQWMVKFYTGSQNLRQSGTMFDYNQAAPKYTEITDKARVLVDSFRDRFKIPGSDNHLKLRVNPVEFLLPPSASVPVWVGISRFIEGLNFGEIFVNSAMVAHPLFDGAKEHFWEFSKEDERVRRIQEILLAEGVYSHGSHVREYDGWLGGLGEWLNKALGVEGIKLLGKNIILAGSQNGVNSFEELLGCEAVVVDLCSVVGDLAPEIRVPTVLEEFMGSLPD